MEILNLRRLKNTVAFSQSLNKFVHEMYTQLTVDRGIDFTFVDGQPYETYEQMKADFEANRHLKISKDFSDTSIFGDARVNWMFRAVHDMQHIDLKLDFSPEQEFMITYKMIQDYRQRGLSQLDIDLLTIEMQGQVIYFVETGTFPDCQRTFTMIELTKLGYKVI